MSKANFEDLFYKCRERMRAAEEKARANQAAADSLESEREMNAVLSEELDVYNQLKDAVIKHFLTGYDVVDKPIVHKGQKSYTAKQMAKEIHDDTEVGTSTMKNLVVLTADLIVRGKERINEDINNI